MPKQHNALYGDDLHNPKGMSVDSHASSSKFVISASNMTITASGFTVKATAFQGDGSGLTGVPANDWDGSHTGNGIITGNLEVQGNSSGSITSTGSWGKVEATKFSGDGSGITGITGEWDGTHTGTATFTGNVTASGIVSASGGFIGDGSNLTGVGGGGGLTQNFSTSQSLAAGDGVIINTDGWVKKVAAETTARHIPMKDYGQPLFYYGAGWQFEGNQCDKQKCLNYDPNAADRFVMAYADHDDSLDGKAMIGTIVEDTHGSNTNTGAAKVSKVLYGGVAKFADDVADSSGILAMCDFIPGSSTKVVVVYRDITTKTPAARVGTISGTAPNEVISWGTENVIDGPDEITASGRNLHAVFDPADTTNGTFIVIADTAANSGSAWVGTVSGTDITWGAEQTFRSGNVEQVRIAADPNNTGKFCCAWGGGDSNEGMLAASITRSGNTITTGSAVDITGANYTQYPVGLSYDPNTTNSIAATDNNGDLWGGIFNGSNAFSWGSAYDLTTWTMDFKFNPHVAGEWGMITNHNNANASYFTTGTLSGTTFTTGGSSNATYTSAYIAHPTRGAAFDWDNVTPGKFSLIFGGHGGYQTTSGRVVTGQVLSTATNLTTSNWAGMATGVTAISQSASITVRGGIASGVTGSGLVPGTNYYLQGDSSLATTADTPSVKAGRALSATDILLTPETTS